MKGYLHVLKKEITIRSGLVISYIILLTFVAVIVTLISELVFKNTLIGLTQKIMYQSSILVEKELENNLAPIRSTFKLTGAMIKENVFKKEVTPALFNYFREFLNDNSNTFGIYFASPTGNYYELRRADEGYRQWVIIRDKQPPSYRHAAMSRDGVVAKDTVVANTGYDARKQIWYIEAQKSGRYWEEPHSSSVKIQTEKTHQIITYAHAIYDLQHHFLGVLAMSLSVSSLIDCISQTTISSHSSVFLLNQDNQILAGNIPLGIRPFVGKKLSSSRLQAMQIEFPSEQLINPNDKYNVIYNYPGKNAFYKIQKLYDLGHGNAFKILIATPQSDVLKPLRFAEGMVTLSTLVILAFGIFIAFCLARRISKPIMQFAEEAKAIQKLDLKKTHLPKNSPIMEIRKLAQGFDTMKTGVRSFERYVPTMLVKALFESGKIAKVGGEMKMLTVLFSDIQGFTSSIEKKDPKDVMHSLSDYLNHMTNTVYQHHGTIDKYVGDLIMAFWGAPIEDEHQANHACECALQMIAKLDSLNKAGKQGVFGQIAVRIGMNTGEAIVGNVGSSDRLNYTALGDNINLASRLESANKIYKSTIIITENTVKNLTRKFPMRLLDDVIVRGKHENIRIYELGPKGFSKQELEHYNPLFAEAFSYYQQGQWQKALDLFDALSLSYPNDYLLTLYHDRCQACINNHPDSWDGIWRLS